MSYINKRTYVVIVFLLSGTLLIVNSLLWYNMTPALSSRQTKIIINKNNKGTTSLNCPTISGNGTVQSLLSETRKCLKKYSFVATAIGLPVNKLHPGLKTNKNGATKIQKYIAYFPMYKPTNKNTAYKKKRRAVLFNGPGAAYAAGRGIIHNRNNGIIIEHKNNYRTLYKGVNTKKEDGELVYEGERIGTFKDTMRYNVIYNGEHEEPQNYFLLSPPDQ